jgi:tRNA(Ile)-lysidine synthase
MIERRFLETLKKHRMIRPGDRVLVAVSGGPDSTAMLALFCGAARRLHVDLHVAHLDHGWRGRESARDAEFVRRLALRMGVPVTVGHAGGGGGAVDAAPADAGADPPRRGRRQSSREARARAARMRFLRETAVAVGAQRIALGHTMDDQAESLVLRLLRGSGARGLGGTYPVVDGLFIRPLIGVRRRDTVQYLRRRRLRYRLDRTNRDLAHLRNRVRRRLIPLLERDFTPAAVEVMARAADLLRDEETWMDALAADAFRRAAITTPECVALAVPQMLEMPPALRRRVLRRAVEEVRGHLRGLTFRHVDQMDALLGRPGIVALDLPGGLRALQRAGELRVSIAPPGGPTMARAAASAGAPATAAGPAGGVPGGAVLAGGGAEGCREAVCPIPGAVELPGLGMMLRARVVPREDPAAAPGPDRACLDADLLPGPLLVRPRRPGDRFLPLGGPGSRKVKSFLIDRKIPLDERGRIPLVLSEGRIAWVVGHRIDERFKVTPTTRRILVLEKETR